MGRARPPSGYSGTPLAVKLGIRPGQEVAVLGGPDGFAESLAAQAGVEVRPDTGGGAPFDVIVFFSPWRADTGSGLGHLLKKMGPGGWGWVPPPNGARQCHTHTWRYVGRVGRPPEGRG